MPCSEGGAGAGSSGGGGGLPRATLLRPRAKRDIMSSLSLSAMPFSVSAGACAVDDRSTSSKALTVLWQILICLNAIPMSGLWNIGRITVGPNTIAIFSGVILLLAEWSVISIKKLRESFE